MGSQDRHAGSGRGVAGAWAGRGGQSGWKDQASHSATPRPSHGPRKGLARRLAWEPVSASSILLCTQPSCTLQGYVLHYLGEKEDLEPTVAVLKGEGLQPGDHLGWASRTGVPFKAVRHGESGPG